MKKEITDCITQESIEVEKSQARKKLIAKIVLIIWLSYNIISKIAHMF